MRLVLALKKSPGNFRDYRADTNCANLTSYLLQGSDSRAGDNTELWGRSPGSNDAAFTQESVHGAVHQDFGERLGDFVESATGGLKGLSVAGFGLGIFDHCGFGGGCVILAHDAQMDEFLDAARVGRVIIHESCHIGTRTIILPGVEVGPRTIVGAGSVISRSLPADTVCAGSPAKVICTLSEYLDKHRRQMQSAPKFDWNEYVANVTPERSAELVAAVRSGDAYIVGGRAAELRGQGQTQRTAS